MHELQQNVSKCCKIKYLITFSLRSSPSFRASSLIFDCIVPNSVSFDVTVFWKACNHLYNTIQTTYNVHNVCQLAESEAQVAYGKIQHLKNC